MYVKKSKIKAVIDIEMKAHYRALELLGSELKEEEKEERVEYRRTIAILQEIRWRLLGSRTP